MDRGEGYERSILVRKINKPGFAKCNICHCDIRYAGGGKRDIISHSKKKKHIENFNVQKTYTWLNHCARQIFSWFFLLPTYSLLGLPEEVQEQPEYLLDLQSATRRRCRKCLEETHGEGHKQERNMCPRWKHNVNYVVKQPAKITWFAFVAHAITSKLEREPCWTVHG